LGLAQTRRRSLTLPNSVIRLIVLAALPIAPSYAAQPGETGAGHSTAMEHPAPHVDGFGFGHPGEARLAQRTVAITMGDMTFHPALVTVKSGEIVRFVITNTSNIDHEFTLGDKATQQTHRKEMAEMTGMEGMHHHDSNAVSVKAHETKDITWAFGQAAALEYDCNIPGHYEAGMTGALIVE
jgi:uncharacterized cupredoxin-like copper-binding protein